MWSAIVMSLVLGVCLALQLTRAQAEVRQPGNRGHVQSAAGRSETILREISATLKSLDRRLERIEETLRKQSLKS